MQGKEPVCISEWIASANGRGQWRDIARDRRQRRIRGLHPRMPVLVKRYVCRYFVWLTLPVVAFAQNTISPTQAAQHIGENAKVCGVVASARYAPRTKGAPTFLNLDKPYPQQVFTAVVWGSSRSRFPKPPESLAGSKICVSGSISPFRGKAEIVVSSPSQI